MIERINMTYRDVLLKKTAAQVKPADKNTPKANTSASTPAKGDAHSVKGGTQGSATPKTGTQGSASVKGSTQVKTTASSARKSSLEPWLPQLVDMTSTGSAKENTTPKQPEKASQSFSLIDWISANPWKAGGIALGGVGAATAIGAYVRKMKQRKQQEEQEQKKRKKRRTISKAR